MVVAISLHHSGFPENPCVAKGLNLNDQTLIKAPFKPALGIPVLADKGATAFPLGHLFNKAFPKDSQVEY